MFPINSVLEVKHFQLKLRLITGESTVIMLIKCMIKFSTRNSILRIYGWI